jgi:copper oxidase (laccase) domain-containing protein
MITLGVLSDLPGIRHGFMTRAGGVSEGIYDSLNCGLGSDDNLDRVRENRRRVLQMAGIPATTLLTAHQIHSPDVLVVEEEWRDGPRPRVDALVTTRKNIAIAASSADCVPILFADPEARVVAAAHAGWRGAVGGVLQATVKQMCALGAKPERIRAGVGPCIGPAELRGRAGISRAVPGAEHCQRTLLPRRSARRPSHVRPRILCRSRARRDEARCDRGGAPRHLRGSGDLLQLSPLMPAQGAGLRATRVGDRADLAGITR